MPPAFNPMNMMLKTFGLGPEFAEGAVKFIGDVQATLKGMSAEQQLVHNTLKQILANQGLAAGERAEITAMLHQLLELAAGGDVPAAATDYASIADAPTTLPPMIGEANA